MSGADIETVTQELDHERNGLRMSERAEIDGRVTDRDAHFKHLEKRRRRIRELERRRDELVAAEEAQADLDHGGAA